MSANIGEKSCETPGAMKSVLKKGSKQEYEELAPPKDTNGSLKRKKVSEKAGVTVAGPASGFDQPADPMSESYASVVKQAEKEVEHASPVVQPVPSSAALGNHSKANGKRLKLDIKNHAADQMHGEQPVGLLHGEKVTVVRSKPPIPPKPDVRTQPQRVSSGGSAGAPNPNGATKGKKQQVTEAQAAHTVQKLLAQNEQMRLELSELRSNLAAERNAVRVLRAQNESDLRKTKAECKKLQEALQHQKRNAAVQCQGVPAGGVPPAKRANRGSGEPEIVAPVSPGGPGTPQHQCSLEVLKLNQEISALRETNKFLEEKYLISSEAERRKASDIRVQRDLHELRLTQLSKSAKNEIQRLLEELKSKERSIAQLKKELQAAQTSGGPGGGCRKERGKAAKNSAQQSHEMRKLRETEPCSGTISKSNSNHSIQSVNEDYEQLDTKESLELTIVTATTTTATTTSSSFPAVPAAEVASSSFDYSDCQTTRNALVAQVENVELAIDTTTYGNDDEAQRPTLPYELCKRTMEAHSHDNSGASSVVIDSKRLRQIVGERQAPQHLPYHRAAEAAKTSTEPEQVSLESTSDADSALSSMSPQPNSFTGDSPDDDPWNVRPNGGSNGEGSAKLERFKQELDELQRLNDSLSRDYTAAKAKIDQLEQDLVKATQATREQTKLNERINHLMQREEDLLKETHELREQNELLEFRIIELEESHDKWSLRSNSSPTVGGGTTKDGWTDTEKEHDELIMMSERSDSGVTSPNSHHHLEDQQSGLPSPCDLSLLDQIPTDDVRKRVIAMTKRACYDEEDKLCLLQILSLLNNLEALSQDHEIAGDDLSLELPVQKYNYSLPESGCPPKVSSTPYKAARIVATVQPFHSTESQPATAAPAAPQAKAPSIASIAETFGGMKKTTRWNNSTSLQESGVFVDEPCSNAATQTELEDFPCLEKTNAELCAEIEKLNRFREKIEECKGAGVPAGAPHATNAAGSVRGSMVGLNLPAPTGDEACDRRRLQFYVERAAMLENKLKVYESSGDQQLRHLAERMEREVQLESWVKQLSEKIGQLELENERLEEERCELEEIENDTRLRLQRLEEDVEVMGQRNDELEMSRSSYQAKYQDAKETAMSLEELVHKYEERIFLLEENENELRERIEMIYMFIPLLLLYNSWQLHEQFKEHLCALQQQQQQRSDHAIQCIPKEHIEYFESGSSAQADDLQVRLGELMNREKELTQNIAELNRAYNETLENADNLWAQMEREYKEKIGRCELEEANLKSKIAQLEERLSKDSEYASERIAHLEEAESALKGRISRLGKENKELAAKHGALVEEYGTLKEDYVQLQNYLRGPAAEALEREKKRVLALEDELAHTQQMLRDGEDSHRSEVGILRGRLLASTKELNHSEVTNSELREEVETLEARIRELVSLRSSDEERIKQLTEELEAKQSQIVALQQARRAGGGGARSSAGRSLAQELERPLKGGAYTRHGYEVHPLNRKFPDSDSSASSSGSGSEDKHKFPFARPSAFETKEVKSLAETIILNAESRGVKTPKKSFVEEMN
ncbi:CAP-Gly domain-containing linker protein 1 [Anopheles ziemanni]|uniref:CAP-Gly domain-containing linker protein 1 n=1 Tax=Anopheles coustani TaxID=139045 RepID=UPI0026595EEF|nr:CAP-Gly domain-containing linker protein 1 [Anopheles coustani]XP_058169641.1 CAP-Gly domain-containing linker protein 1 [Anopheles ziemanni]